MLALPLEGLNLKQLALASEPQQFPDAETMRLLRMPGDFHVLLLLCYVIEEELMRPGILLEILAE